jgi:hypothetical protein
MRWKITDRNPTSLVRQSAKRERVPDVLTAEEIGIFGGQNSSLAERDDNTILRTISLGTASHLLSPELQPSEYADCADAQGKHSKTGNGDCAHPASPLQDFRGIGTWTKHIAHF